MATKANKKRKTVTFAPEDEAVAEILNRAEKRGRGERTKLINEAIRQCGDSALLSVLNREIEMAQAKYRDAEVACSRRKVV